MSDDIHINGVISDCGLATLGGIPVDVIVDAIDNFRESRRLRVQICEAKKRWLCEFGRKAPKPAFIVFSDLGLLETLRHWNIQEFDEALGVSLFKDGPDVLIGRRMLGMTICVDEQLDSAVPFQLRADLQSSHKSEETVQQ